MPDVWLKFGVPREPSRAEKVHQETGGDMAPGRGKHRQAAWSSQARKMDGEVMMIGDGRAKGYVHGMRELLQLCWLWDGCLKVKA